MPPPKANVSPGDDGRPCFMSVGGVGSRRETVYGFDPFRHPWPTNARCRRLPTCVTYGERTFDDSRTANDLGRTDPVRCGQTGASYHPVLVSTMKPPETAVKSPKASLRSFCPTIFINSGAYPPAHLAQMYSPPRIL